MRSYERRLGILGGMGPEATAGLYLNIIRRCQEKLGAKYNSDFPHMVINSVPVPDGQMWRGFDRDRVIETLQEGCRLLERSGVDFIVVPCNSAHYFIGAMREAVGISVVSLVEETTRAVKQRGLDVVSVLGTRFTLSMGIYERHLQDQGIRVVNLLEEQKEEVDRIIVRIESGARLQSDKAFLKRVMEDLRQRGAHGIILGCTEIPLLVRQEEVSIPLFDTIEILASSSFELLTGENPSSRGLV
ncbi:MAG: amino acid racemase [Deltaproteobacteria bacterium]|nr:amino acid racemase [Deltaproteobacteria bacterium]